MSKFSEVFDFIDWKDATVEPIYTGSINQLWKISSVKHASSLVLKRSSHRMNEEWKKHANCLMSILHNARITHSYQKINEEYFFEVDGSIHTLSMYISGGRFEYQSSNQANQVAEIIRNISSLEVKLNIHFDFDDDVASKLKDKNLISKINNFIELASIPLPYLQEHKNILIKMNDSNLYSAIKAMPNVISHGELMPSNIIFNPNKISLIDFDRLNLRPRIIDIATFIAFFCRKEKGSFNLNMTLVDDLLKTMNLSSDEIKYLPYVAYLYLLPTEYIVNMFFKKFNELPSWYLPWSLGGSLSLYNQLKDINGKA